METLQELKRTVSADGRLSREEIDLMREHLLGGDGMNIDKGNFLFEFSFRHAFPKCDSSYYEAAEYS